jgi:hypothetical protein
MVVTTRSRSSAAVLLCALLLQNCQSHALRATEGKEPAVDDSFASVMHQRTSGEQPSAMQAVISLSASPAAHGTLSRSETTPLQQDRSTARPFCSLSLVARNILTTVSHSPTALYQLTVAAMYRASRAVPLGKKKKPGHTSSSGNSGVCVRKVEGVLREMLSDEEADSKPPAQQRSTTLAPEDDLANERVRAGENAEPDKAKEAAKDVRLLALKTLEEVERKHSRGQGGQSGDPLTILLDMASSQPDRAIQFLDVLLVAARDNGCRQQALEALGKVAQASPDMLSECLPSLRAAAKAGDRAVRLLASKTLGEVEWKHYFGEVEPAPDLPQDMVAILDSACPFWPEERVKDTHLLVLMPATVDGKSFTLNLLRELIQRPKSDGHKMKYRYYGSGVKEQLGAASSAASYWLLMTRDVLPGSRDKSYTDQKELIAAYASRTGLPYELPKILEAATAILTHHVRNGERLYSDNPWTYTRCQELIVGPEEDEEYPSVVGGFESSGLRVSITGYDAYSGGGVAGVRKLF